VGAVHGLAGSGAMTALVLATIPSLVSRLVYLLFRDRIDRRRAQADDEQPDEDSTTVACL